MAVLEREKKPEGANAEKFETPLEYLTRRGSSLKNTRSKGWDYQYRDLVDYITPYRGRFVTTDRNDGRKKNLKMLNGHPRKSARTLASGMMAGLTSPTRPWFNLETSDPKLMDSKPVQEWCDEVESRMNTVFQKSNLYQALPNFYEELAVFGTAAMVVLEDYEDVIRVFNFTVGEYMIAADERGRVMTLFREYESTVDHVVKKYGIDKCSEAVQMAYKNGNYDQAVTLWQAIEPNDDRIDLKMGKGRPFRSLVWEAGASRDKGTGNFLEAKGFHENPLLCARWSVNGNDDYGTGCGHDALPDCKELQTMEKRKRRKLEKHDNPTMRGPASLKNSRSSTLPGDITYDGDNQRNRYEPAYQVDANIDPLRFEIRDKERQIDEFFYADLFLMLAQSDRRQITAREIEERHEEKMLMLGPVLTRLNDEVLNPLIDRVYGIMFRAGLFPQPPEELRDTELKVEYTSILAQAQRAVDIAIIEDVAKFAGYMMPTFPSIGDRFNAEESIKLYAKLRGAPAKIINSDDEVEKTRKARSQKETEQMAPERAAQAVESAKLLSQTDTGGDNALTNIMGIA